MRQVYSIKSRKQRHMACIMADAAAADDRLLASELICAIHLIKAGMDLEDHVENKIIPVSCCSLYILRNPTDLDCEGVSLLFLGSKSSGRSGTLRRQPPHSSHNRLCQSRGGESGQNQTAFTLVHEHTFWRRCLSDARRARSRPYRGCGYPEQTIGRGAGYPDTNDCLLILQ